MAGANRFKAVSWMDALAGAVALVALAGVVCWAGSGGALLVSGLFRHSSQAVSAMLLGMFFRMGLPLMVIFLLLSSGGPLLDAGVVGMIVVYYLISLVVETILSLRLVGPQQQVSKAS